jgi:hypothetical protein
MSDWIIDRPIGYDGSKTWDRDNLVWSTSSELIKAGGGHYKNNIIIVSKDKIYIGE